VLEHILILIMYQLKEIKRYRKKETNKNEILKKKYADRLIHIDIGKNIINIMIINF